MGLPNVAVLGLPPIPGAGFPSVGGKRALEAMWRTRSSWNMKGKALCAKKSREMEFLFFYFFPNKSGGKLSPPKASGKNEIV